MDHDCRECIHYANCCTDIVDFNACHKCMDNKDQSEYTASRKGNKMRTIHSAHAAIRSFSSFSLTGEPMETSVHYCGDCYQVITQSDSYFDTEYFVHLHDAIAYAETV